MREFGLDVRNREAQKTRVRVPGSPVYPLGRTTEEGHLGPLVFIITDGHFLRASAVFFLFLYHMKQLKGKQRKKSPFIAAP